MTVTTTEVQVPTGDGSMRTFNARPDGSTSPNVILYMDAVGYRDELKEFARRLACEGYSAWVPDLYHRDGGPSFDPHHPQEDFELFAPLMRKLTREVVVRDTNALVRWMAAEPKASNRMGTIGFCMGGRMALWAAAEHPDKVRAAVSLHGGQLGTASPDSPHRFAHRLSCEVYLGFASDDDLVPKEHIETMLGALDTASVRYEMETHADTRHGYMFPQRRCYNQIAAEASWARVLALFARTLRDVGNVAEASPRVDAGQAGPSGERREAQ